MFLIRFPQFSVFYFLNLWKLITRQKVLYKQLFIGCFSSRWNRFLPLVAVNSQHWIHSNTDFLRFTVTPSLVNVVPLIWICPVMTSSPTSFANEEPLQGCRSFKRAQPKHESELLVCGRNQPRTVLLCQSHRQYLTISYAASYKDSYANSKRGLHMIWLDRCFIHLQEKFTFPAVWQGWRHRCRVLKIKYSQKMKCIKNTKKINQTKK